MGASLIVPVRQALVTAVGGLAAFTGPPAVPVMYAYRSTDSREFAYVRKATFTHEPAAMRSGRNFRKEVATLEFVIWVEFPGGSPTDAVTRAFVLGLAVEEYVADNKNGIGGAQTLLVAGEGSLNEMTSDSSSFVELMYPIRYTARLT